MRSQIDESMLRRRQIHTIQTDTYMLELTFCDRRGLSIRVLEVGLIQRDEYLEMNICDQAMSQALRNVFQGVYQLFLFMKNQDGYNVDIDARVIMLKYLNIQGQSLIKQSLKLPLQPKKLNHDKVTSYFLRTSLKKLTQKLQKNTEDLQQKLQAILKQRQKQKQRERERANINVHGNHINSDMIKIVAVFAVVVVGVVMVGCSVMSGDCGSQRMGDVGVDYQKFKNQIKRMQQQIQNNSNNANFKQLLSLINQFSSQLHNIKQSLPKQTPQTETPPQTQPQPQPQPQTPPSNLPHLQKQIEQLQKITKRLSIFDLTSKYLQSFQIDSYSVSYLGISGRRTQILLRDQVPFQRAVSYKFRVVSAGSNVTVAIGVVDVKKAKDQRSSIHLKNTIAYTGRGELWKDGVKSDKLGKGFQEGSVVTMQVDLSKGSIKWISDGMITQETLQQTTSQNLRDNFIQYRPYLQLSTKGDTIEMIPIIQS